MNFVPSVRLLWWVALLGVPCAAAFGLIPGAQTVALGAILLLAFAAAVDILTSRQNLRDLQAQQNEIARLGVNREDRVRLHLKWDGSGELNVRLALALPREIYYKADWVDAIIPASKGWHLVDYPCVALRRGAWKMQFLFAQRASILGLWEIRAKIPLDLQIRVYPNLARDRSGSAAVFLNKGMSGLHLQRMTGKGREFDKLREYLPGDSYEDIHWKSTAKRRRPITKTFQIERTQEVYVVLDASRLSTRETGVPMRQELGALVESAPEDLLGRVTLLERFVTSAMLVALAAEKQGDLFGMAAFNEKVSRFVRARNGLTHYNACREALHALQPKLVSPDFDELAAFLRTRLRRRALLIFLTSLDDPVIAEAFLKNIKPIARHHLVMVNMINPGNLHPLFEGPKIEKLDQIYEALAGHEGWAQLRETERELRGLGVGFQLLSDERFTPGLITQYLNVKQRQLI